MVKSIKKSYSKRKTQKGGVSSSCLSNYASNNGGACYDAKNPQASLDLDNASMLYGNPIPLGESIVGGGDKCGDEGVGTSNFKTEIFKDYLEKLNSNFNISAIGGFNKMQKRNNKKSFSRKNKSVSRKNTSFQKGSGYAVDPSEFIGAQPVYKSYDDASPPAIVGGQMVFGAPDQPVCGFGAVKGGSRKRSKKHMKKHKNTKSKSNSKSKSNKKSKRKSQRGGDFTSIGNSKPAEYSTAFNGQPGVFKYPDDMSGRTFDETQPVWSPQSI